ncbi:fibroblast growth factor 1-like isoform X2 [Anneissia japonica]|uniref:fibroblast growth factor 1-like isoform X2 n=1 Tax=Anneissia japonica TaxID=1529436 RepID=UPI0014258CFF|nr:fibroblast growth factor 1-like isoform X2 [Anneissia japonica]
MDVNIRCWVLITFAAFFSAKLREVMAEGRMVRKQLYSKTQYTLAILADGSVTNSDDIDIKYTYLHINSHAEDVVTIKGEVTGYYVCMNDEGRIYGSTTMVEECEFVESLTADNFIYYYRSISKKNSTKIKYLAISSNGHVKSVPHQRSLRDRVKFSVIRIES